jgi:hypothetical protein
MRGQFLALAIGGMHFLFKVTAKDENILPTPLQKCHNICHCALETVVAQFQHLHIIQQVSTFFLS